MSKFRINLSRILVTLAAGALLSACGGGGGGSGDNNNGGGGTDPGDTTAPSVTAVYPFDGLNNIPPNSLVNLIFSEALDSGSITTGSVSLSAGNTAVAGTVEYSADTHAATFIPDQPLAPNTAYTLEVADTVRDLAGNRLAVPFTSHLTTGASNDVTPPAVLITTPSANATGVSLNTQVSANFNEPMDPATITADTVRIEDAGGVPVSGRLSYSHSSRNLTFVPDASLNVASQYTVTLTTGVTDMANNSLAAPVSWSFRTNDDISPPPPPPL